jgi:hypothetical protein
MRKLLFLLLISSVASAQTIDPLRDSAVVIIKRVKPIDTSRVIIRDTVTRFITVHDTIYVKDTIPTIPPVTPPVTPPSTPSSGKVSAVSTFNSISLYWSGVGGSSVACNVLYRLSGSQTWKDGLPLYYDTRTIGGRSPEYRGSLVYLSPGSTYEVLLSAGKDSNYLKVSTWSETFPVASITNLTSPTTISSGGTASGYKVFTGSINGGTNNIYINAPYVIIRGMTLTGAGEDAIVIGPNAHHVVIEGCDISGWGYVGMGSNNQAAVRIKGLSYNASNVKQIIVQRNKIHDSRDPGSGWDAGSTHALGPNGINFEVPGGNNVIRYNTVKSDDPNRRFMDGIGGADNFTTQGFPGPDSDIYGNLVDGIWDDAIEVEGGGMNVRVYNNFVNNTFTGIASATCAIGPLYIFNNISNVGQRLHGVSNGTLDSEDRGPFNKCGSQDATVRGGRTYLFHNTVLQPTQSGFNNPRGLDGGIVDNGGPLTNVVSMNNIWTSAYTGKGGLPIAMWQGGGQNCTSNNDLLSPNSTNGTFTIINRITGTPKYLNAITLTLNVAGYYLAPGSPGQGKAAYIPGFNQPGADLGAEQTGQPPIKFGIQ